MELIFGIILGALIGGGGVYMLLHRTIAQREQEIRHNKRIIEDLEKSRESRLQETIQSLQSDYQQKLNQKTTELTQNYERRIQELSRKASQPPANQPKSRDTIASSTAPVQLAQPSQPTSTMEPSVLPAQSASNTMKQTAGELYDASLQSEESPQAATRSAAEPLETQLRISKSSEPSEPSSIQPERSVEQRQLLIDSILKMGNSHNMNHLLELQRLLMTSSRDVREASAIAMGNIIAANAGNLVVAQSIPALGKLSQDPDALVRCAAITALGHTQSPKAIPFIRRSLRDSDLRVVKVANDAIGRFKYFRSRHSQQASSKKKFSKENQVEENQGI